MSKKQDYDTLWNMYNVAIAKSQDLQEQLSTKQRQWEKRDKDFADIEKLIRELCESILMKDPNEMVLGKDYSWRNIPTRELILKANRAFQKYKEDRKDLMNKIMDIAEQRREEIESLKEQISRLITNPASNVISQEQLEAQIEKEKKEKETLAAMPQAVKEKIADGTVEAILTDDHDDFDFMEEKIYKDTANVSAKTQITPKSIPVAESKKRMEQKRKRKEEAAKAYMIDLKDYEGKINDVEWIVMEVIGTEGVSIYNEIESKVFEKDPTITQNKLRTAVGKLYSTGFLSKEPIKNPLKGTLYVHSLTMMGVQVFKRKFDKEPVLSEMDAIKAEHDNCTHGYAIKFIADELRQSGYFKEVEDKNRKKPIKIKEGISYIPDIVCTDKNNAKMYIEYECANHTSTNFYAKCNKMCSVTSVLNFIVPNRETSEKIMGQVMGWIENRGARNLNNIIIRITTAVQMKDKDLKENKNWKIVFQPGKKKDPYINF